MTATKPSVPRLHVGTSGWSYPSWRPGFYPAEVKPAGFLAYYAERLSTVELNTTGYRIPAEEQFRRWAAQTPPEFRFAVKLNSYRINQAATFAERVGLLGERLGPTRVLVNSARDEGLLTLIFGSFDDDFRFAFDFRHESWAGIEHELPENAACVNALEGAARFRYLRFRDPPYSDEELAEWAAQIRPLLDEELELFCYFRHEDEPTAPGYAERLLQLVG